MTDRPIIFSGPMVRALIEGRKTQTRRLIKWEGPRGFPHSFEHARIDNPAGVPRLLVPFHHPEEPTDWEDCAMHRHYGLADPCDRLWVREAMRWTDTLVFDADKAPVDLDRMPAGFTAGREHVSGMFMPRWASRLTLTVTEVGVQRLQDISEDDAAAEGVHATRVMSEGYHLSSPSFVESFHGLWNSLHGPDAWGANPWVVALTFTIQHGNIDQFGKA